MKRRLPWRWREETAKRAAAAVVAALLAVCACAQDGEVTLDGKPLATWMKQLRSETRGLQLRAARTLAEAPTNLHAQLAPVVLPLLKSERENDRFVAAQVLGEYGAAARAAVPDLLPLLQGTQYERNRAATAKALGQILKDAPPSDETEKVTQALVTAFDDGYSDVRREAVNACGLIGPSAKACIPALAKRFGDRGLAAQPWLEQAERALVERAAVWTAGRMGPLAACHMDRLVAMIGGDNGDVVCEAIAKIGPTQGNIVPNLATMIERGHAWENTAAKASALVTLASFGPKAAAALPLLERFLRERTFQHSDSAKMNILVLRAVQGIGPAAASCAPLLKQYAELKEFPHAAPEDVAAMNKAAQAALGAVTAGETGAK
jgi:hypothetical protein